MTDLDTRPGRCYCAGCIGMGPCDDGTPCAYNCGRRASNPWGTCGPCENEVMGRDIWPDDDERGTPT